MRIILFFFLVFIEIEGFAQSPPMWHLTDEQGLPSMTVYDVFQDSKGYLWFGTELGACRYDGNKFQVFAPQTSKGQAVSYVQEDSKGLIYFKNFAGQLFYIQQDSVYTFELIEELKKNGFGDYFIDNQDHIWFTGNVSTPETFEYDLKTKQWQHYPIVVLNFQESENGTFYAMGHKHLYQKIGKDWQELPFSIKHPNSDLFVYCIDKQVVIINRTNKELWQYENGAFFRLDNELINRGDFKLLGLRYDKSYNFWLLTFSGVYGFDTRWQTMYRGNALLKGKATSDILQDREGNYWITTLRDGVFMMPSKDVLVFNTENSNLSDNSINKMAVDDEGNLLLALNNGIAEVFNPKKQKIIHQYQTGITKDVESVYFDSQHKTVFVSSQSFYAFKKGQKKPFGAIGAAAGKDMAIFQGDKFIVADAWTAQIADISQNPIGIQKPKATDFFYQKYPPVLVANGYYQMYLRKVRSRAVWVENNQRFWVAYADGLFYYENGEKELKTIKNESIIAKCFTSTSDGILWVGTLNQGIFGILDKKIIYHFHKNNILPSNHCRALDTDGKNLWLGTDIGAIFLNLRNRQIKIFSQPDGNISKEIMDLKLQKDTLWLATTKGLLMLPVKTLKTNQTAPQIYITDLKIWEKSYLKGNEYLLDYEQNNLKIEFQGLAFRSRGVFKYKYRMLGLDDNWIYTESIYNFARFPSLPTGKYEFQVKAINEDGVESEGIAILHIQIYPPFWQTWWFILSTFGMLIGLVSLVFWLRISALQRNNQIEQAMRQSQLAALQVQMNPHFIFNALNSIQEFILLNEKRLANEYLGKFADLMRLTLDMSNLQQVSLNDEITHLQLYLDLEKLRFEDLIFDLQIDNQLNPAEIHIPTMLIQPYIENSLKHGLLHKKTDRKLWIRFHLDSQVIDNQKVKLLNELICEIEDNGIGRTKSEELRKNRPRLHKSFATSATQKRLDLLNHNRKQAIRLEILDLKNDLNEACGTKIRLIIPIV